MEVSFDGNLHKCIIFFLVVETLVFMTAFPSGLLRCYNSLFHLSMEVIIARIQSSLQTLINQACRGEDYYAPILL